MYTTSDNLGSIKLEELKSHGFELDDMLTSYNRVLGQLKPAKFVLDKCHKISNSEILPLNLKGRINELLDDFLKMLNEIEKPKESGESTQDFFNRKKNLLDRIDRYSNTAFEISSSNTFLMICSAVINFEQDNLKEKKSEFSLIEKTFENYVVEAKIKFAALEDSLKQLEVRATGVLKEIQDKSAMTVVSNYAKVFTTEAEGNRKASYSWLTAGILMCLLSGLILVGIFQWDWFNSSERITENGSIHYIYDYSKLVSKFLFISIFLFLISYSFRKYSIYKHLQTINKHRQNALNSYRMLTESIIGEDLATRNSLMLQVAKAIYEQTPTGFLPTKDSQSQTSEILEVTKILSNGKS
jgi:hypothetical protein